MELVYLYPQLHLRICLFFVGLCIKILSRFVCIWEKWTSGGQKKKQQAWKNFYSGRTVSASLIFTCLNLSNCFLCKSTLLNEFTCVLLWPTWFLFPKINLAWQKKQRSEETSQEIIKNWTLKPSGKDLTDCIGFKKFLVFFAKCSYKLVNYKLCGNKATFQSFILNTQKGDLWICQLCHVIKAFQDTWHICLFTHSFTCSI